MKIKNLRIRRKAVSVVLSSALVIIPLAGCGNANGRYVKTTYNKAIIFDENSATIVNVKEWCFIEQNKIRICTEDDFWFVTSVFDTKLIDDIESDMSAEDFARAIKGEDIEIEYFNKGYQKTKKKS